MVTMRQGFIEVLIVLGVVGAVAFIVTFNPWKHEQLPPIPMVELKAEESSKVIADYSSKGKASEDGHYFTGFDPIPPQGSAQDGNDKFVNDVMQSCLNQHSVKGIVFPSNGMVVCYIEGKDQSKQIRALTKRIEEIEKHLGPWTEMLPENIAKPEVQTPACQDGHMIIIATNPPSYGCQIP